MADRTGQQLGNYHLLRKLGQGGFAEVYLGEHLYLGTLVALKILHTQVSGDDLDHFRKEARTIAQLIHPHIVRVFDFGAEETTPYLVMDYAPNGSIRTLHPKNTPLPLLTILEYTKQIADALQYAHDEHFIHRDVKPENLLVGRRKEILLSDFGIALLAQSSRSQSIQDVAGTATYMAPEQFQGKPRPASDQYSLGIMIYEWLSGTRPFHGSFTEIASQHLFAPPPPLLGKIPTVSPVIEQVVMTALAKDPKQRFQSVAAFSVAFEQSVLETLQSPTSSGQKKLPVDASAQNIPVSPTPLVAPSEQKLPPSTRNHTSPILPSGSAVPPTQASQPPLHTEAGRFPDTMGQSTASPSISPPYTSPATYTPRSYENISYQPGERPSVPLRTRENNAPPTQSQKKPSMGIAVGSILLVIIVIAAGIFYTVQHNSNVSTGQISSGSSNGSNTPSSSAGVNGKGCTKIGVLLPETATSSRWDGTDRPDLIKDITATVPGTTVDYYNAQGDAPTQQNQADQALTRGDCILVVAPQDSVASAAIVTKAKASQIPVIAYDRLIQSKDLNYYVSFDSEQVGKLQGQYIVDHYRQYVNSSNNNVALINGSRTDQNAINFNKGVEETIKALIDNGSLKKVYDQFTPNWDNSTAQTEMEQALTANNNNIQIAYVANDGMANSVIAALKAQRLNGKVLVTGQDATIAGFQNILKGDQAMTVYKPINQEAQVTADIIKALNAGTTPANITSQFQTTDGGSIPSILETPIAVDKTNINDTVIKDGYVTRADICAGIPAGTDGVC